MTSQFADILRGGDGGWLEPVDLRSWGLTEDPAPEPSLPGSGIPGSGIPGSGIPGSGIPGSGIPGSGIPDSGGADSDLRRLAAIGTDAAGAAGSAELWRQWLPGGLSRPGGTAGAGFAAGEAADDLRPGVVLAGLTARAWLDRERVSDDELIGMVRAWRRLSAWVAAGELAAVAELVARRTAQVGAGADPHIAEHVDDEIAAALTLTGRSADQLVTFAVDLTRLPATAAALAAGEIDRARAAVIADGTSCLSAEHAAAVEAAVIGRAPAQTTSQLRAAVKRAALAADPAAADRRRREALRRARVETWDEQAGTAALAGRDLPPADVLAADRRIDALARQLRQSGAEGSLDGLRARVYTALLLGIPLPVLLSQLTPACRPDSPASSTVPGDRPGRSGCRGASRDDSGQDQHSQDQHSQDGHGQDRHNQDGHGHGQDRHNQDGHGQDRHNQDGHGQDRHNQDGGEDSRRGSGSNHSGGNGNGRGSGNTLDRSGDPGVTRSLTESLPGAALAGSLNLTMPISTWLGGDEPGEAGGYWPLPAADARGLAQLLAGRPGTRICLTITAGDGTALGHGCTRVRRRSGQGGTGLPELTFTIRPLATPGTCQHEHESPGYRPPPLLRHRVTVRRRRCGFPGCGRPAAQCDLDHTAPYDQGGRTCECNLAPLCRSHHRAKQTEGWQLRQETDGTLVWTLPHGRHYRAGPVPYPPG